MNVELLNNIFTLISIVASVFMAATIAVDIIGSEKVKAIWDEISTVASAVGGVSILIWALAAQVFIFA